MQPIIDTMRSWYADLPRRSAVLNRPWRPARRLLQPELLESRHAPSGVIPFELMSALVADDSGGSAIVDESQQMELRASYRRGNSSTTPEWHTSRQDFAEELLGSEVEREQSPPYTGAARQFTEIRGPAEMAAVHSAFESFSSSILTWVGELVPPPVIQPVEPELQPHPEPGQGGDETQLSLPADGTNDEPLMNENDPIHNEVESGMSDRAPQMPGETVNPGAEVPPMLIQPVIMDPESEHNQPSPPTDGTPSGAEDK